MKAVITVVGKDMVGILANISNECAKNNINILEVSQSVLSDMFCMIMIVDVSKMNTDFGAFADHMKEAGVKLNMVIHVMHEDIFNSMHNI